MYTATTTVHKCITPILYRHFITAILGEFMKAHGSEGFATFEIAEWYKIVGFTWEFRQTRMMMQHSPAAKVLAMSQPRVKFSQTVCVPDACIEYIGVN